MVHVLLKPGLENFEHTLLPFEMSAIVWLCEQSLALPFYGIGMNFSSSVSTFEFSNFDGILSETLP